MLLIDIQLQCRVRDSFRVQQVVGMFDLPWTPTLGERFCVEVPGLDEPWRIGAIVGPSGSGKTAVARQAFAGNFYAPSDWREDRAVIDCLGDWPIRTITQTLSAVGFSSPPSWLKPYAVLSNGERFRCELARALLGEGPGDDRSDLKFQISNLKSSAGDGNRDLARRHSPSVKSVAEARQESVPLPLVVFDEFTSVVDRTAARIGSAAVARAIRDGRIPRRLVAVTCHDDVLPWLAPDWVLDMGNQSLTWECLRRPSITLAIRRAHRSAWTLFQRHHYLSGSLHRSAQCFVGEIEGRPAAFTAVLPFPHPIRPGWREHRTVCLPDFQGIGIGAAMSEFIASLFIACGKPYFSTTGHPAVIRSRAASKNWRMCRRPSLVSQPGRTAGNTAMGNTLSLGRFTAGFEYVGLPRVREATELGLLSHGNKE